MVKANLLRKRVLFFSVHENYDTTSVVFLTFDLLMIRNIPIIMKGKLKISFQGKKSPGAFWPLSQQILVRFSKFFFLLKAYEKCFQKQA